MTLVARSESGYRAVEGAKLGEQEHIEHHKFGAFVGANLYFIIENNYYFLVEKLHKICITIRDCHIGAT